MEYDAPNIFTNKIIAISRLAAKNKSPTTICSYEHQLPEQGYGTQ